MSIKDFTPLHKYVAIKPDESKTQSGLIIIPENVKDKDQYKSQIGTITHKSINVIQFEINDKVIFGAQGIKVRVNGEDLVLMSEDDILLKL